MDGGAVGQEDQVELAGFRDLGAVAEMCAPHVAVCRHAGMTPSRVAMAEIGDRKAELRLT